MIRTFCNLVVGGALAVLCFVLLVLVLAVAW